MPDPTQPATPGVPPPTAEVTVRTMQSDLEAIRASGGAVIAPQGAATGISGDHDHPVPAGVHSHLLSSVLGWLAVLVSLAALLAGGWLVYAYLTRTAPIESATTPTSTTAAPAAATSTGTLADLPVTVAFHNSQIKQEAQFRTSFPVVPATGDLKTHFQLIREGLGSIPSVARVTEVTPTDAQNRPLSFAGYLAAVGAADLLPPQVLSDFFADDFTLLAVRGEGGFSAAYVLALKPNATWIYAEPGFRAIEGASDLSNLFLQVPGKQASAFEDGTIKDYPVRTAQYSEPAGTFTYGFFRDRLVIATSQQALDETLLRLCLDPGGC